MSSEQKLPIGTYFNQRAASKVLQHIQLMSGKAPATLMQAQDSPQGGSTSGSSSQVTNTVWMINFETDGTYTLPQVVVPVHTSEYTRVPYKQGDKGFVSSSDMDLGSMTGLGSQDPASFARPANLASLIWHPLGNVGFKPAIDPTAHETYGNAGGTITHDGTQKSVVRTHATDGTVISSGAPGGAMGASNADGPHKITAHPTNGTSIETPAAHTLSANNATLDAAGNQTNQGNSTTQQNITSTGGNVSAPAGAVSGASGNFATGAIGGLPFSGGGGGVSGLVSSIATALNGGAGGAGGAFLGAAAFGSGAAATNVGTLGGDLGGTLPAPQVKSLLNVDAANLPSYNSHHAAVLAGLAAGALYVNPTISSTSDLVVCVMY